MLGLARGDVSLTAEDVMHRARHIEILQISLLTLTCCLARPAAAGINLSWNDCGAFGSVSTPLLCTTNTGRITMMLSATPTGPIPQACAEESVIDLQTSGAVLSPWWDMRSGLGCRSTSCFASFDFTSFSNCADPWLGQALGGLDYADALSSGSFAPNRARIRTISAVPTSSAFALAAGTEYYMASVSFNMLKTVGGACPGCTDDATLSLSQIRIDQVSGAPGGDFILRDADNGVCIRTNAPPSATQCSALPTSNRTWGSLKAMYR
jgi:hypothetical protein